MALKLFTPTEVRTVAEERQSKDVARASQIRDITDELIKKRTEAERAFDSQLTAQQKIWEEKERIFHEKRIAFEREIEVLERRKKTASSPLLLSGKKLHTLAEQLSAKENALKEKELALEEERQMLFAKLNEVGDREQNISDRLKSLELKEIGVEKQRRDVAEGSKRLSDELSRFKVMQEAFSSQYALKRAEIDSEHSVIKEANLRLEEREKEIELAKLLIKDREQMLERGFAELKQKQNDFIRNTSER